jgi:hypothetical protein
MGESGEHSDGGAGPGASSSEHETAGIIEPSKSVLRAGKSGCLKFLGFTIAPGLYKFFHRKHKLTID